MPKSAAERSREYRARKKQVNDKMMPKSAAERSREYRARKKQAKEENGQKKVKKVKSSATRVKEYRVRKRLERESAARLNLSQTRTLPVETTLTDPQPDFEPSTSNYTIDVPFSHFLEGNMIDSEYSEISAQQIHNIQVDNNFQNVSGNKPLKQKKKRTVKSGAERARKYRVRQKVLTDKGRKALSLEEDEILYSRKICDFDDKSIVFKEKHVTGEFSNERKLDNDLDPADNSKRIIDFDDNFIGPDTNLVKVEYITESKSDNDLDNMADNSDRMIDYDDNLLAFEKKLVKEELFNESECDNDLNNKADNSDCDDNSIVFNTKLVKAELSNESKSDDLENTADNFESMADLNNYSMENNEELEECSQRMTTSMESDIHTENVFATNLESIESDKIEDQTLGGDEDKRDSKDVIIEPYKNVLRESTEETKLIIVPELKADNVVKIVLTKKQQMEELLKRKRSKGHFKAIFKCSDCVISFISEEKYEKHMACHDKSRGEWQCDICKLRYSKSSQLDHHLKSHRIKYKCLTRGVLITTQEQLTLLRKQDDLIMFGCEVCREKFPSEPELTGHTCTGHPVEYVCDHCGDYFPSEDSLKVHQTMSEDCKKPKITILECKRCNLHFDKFQPWYNHTVGHAALGKEEPPPTECMICGHDTTSWNEWTDHVCREHRKKRTHAYNTANRPKRTIDCDLCGKVVRTNYYLTVHKYRHHPETRKSDEAPFKKFKWTQQCEVCNKTLLKHNLKRHMYTHTGEKPYRCDLCGKSYTQAGNRDWHVKTVHTK